MNYSIISVRYAKALLLVGTDNKCLDAIKADMELIGATIKENEVFRQLLNNPIVKPPQKRGVMKELLEKRVHQQTLNFVNLLIRNRREAMLADVARDFSDLYDKSKGIKRAQFVSAIELSSAAKQKLQKQLDSLFKANVQINTQTNPELIGGFVLRVGDQQYDATLSSALKRMKKAMIN